MATRRSLGRLCTVAAGALALLDVSARPASGVTISFAHFADTTGLTLNGSAAAVPTGDGTVLRIVPAAAAKAGSVFSSTAVRTADFSTAFSFRLTNPGGITDAQGEQGADGFVFVVQPVASNVGGAGSGLGYAGITPSVGVEFDIFYNGASDTSTNHLGVDLNGNVNSVAAIHVSPRWDDGNRWWAWIDYDGTTLEVRVDQTSVRPVDPLLSHTVDLATVLGQEEAFVGFTAGTGSAWADHDVIEWTYFDAYNPGGTTTTTATAITTTTTSTTTSVTTTSSSTSTTATVTTTTSVTTTTTATTPGNPIAGKKLLLTDKPNQPRRRKLELLAKDPGISIGAGNGSADDPTLAGGTLRVVASRGDGFDALYDLPAAAWRRLGREGEQKGYKLKNAPPIKTVLVKPGKVVKVEGKGDGLGHSLAADPESVSVVLTLGGQRHCLAFGGGQGTVQFRPGRKFLAKDASAPTACPGSP